MYRVVLAKKYKVNWMKKIAFIGYGAMAKIVHEYLPGNIQLAWVVATEQSREAIQKKLGATVQVVSRIQDLDGKPDLIVEMAGQVGLKTHVFDVLRKRWNIAVISVGAFAERQFELKVRETAIQYASQIIILPGAIAGIDGIAAARTMGLNKVVYQGRKPPKSWKGSYAEKLVDLDELSSANVFFSGTAREAACLFPANANVAATIALAGLGMDDTRVELIADPGINRNQHSIQVEGGFGELNVEILGIALKDNPKTSTLAALSVVRACYQIDDVLVI